MMTYIAAAFALLFCVTVICTIILRMSWKDQNDRLKAECGEKQSNCEYQSQKLRSYIEFLGKAQEKQKSLKQEVFELREELSKKTVKCRKCGQFHKARKEILGGAMPGETLCGENYCKVYDDRPVGEGA